MPHLAINGASPVRTKPFPTWPVYTEEDAQAVSDTILSGKWGSSKGDQVHTFEDQFATFQQAKHGIAVTNGTTALNLALQSVGLPRPASIMRWSTTLPAGAPCSSEATTSPTVFWETPGSGTVGTGR